MSMKQLYNIEIRKWSTWLSAVGTAIYGWWSIDPNTFLMIWNMLPYEVKGLIPRNYAIIISGTVWVFAIIAKFIPQRKLDRWRHGQDIKK